MGGEDAVQIGGHGATSLPGGVRTGAGRCRDRDGSAGPAGEPRSGSFCGPGRLVVVGGQVVLVVLDGTVVVVVVVVVVGGRRPAQAGSCRATGAAAPTATLSGMTPSAWQATWNSTVPCVRW